MLVAIWNHYNLSALEYGSHLQYKAEQIHDVQFQRSTAQRALSKESCHVTVPLEARFSMLACP